MTLMMIYHYIWWFSSSNGDLNNHIVLPLVYYVFFQECQGSHWRGISGFQSFKTCPTKCQNIILLIVYPDYIQIINPHMCWLNEHCGFLESINSAMTSIWMESWGTTYSMPRTYGTYPWGLHWIMMVIPRRDMMIKHEIWGYPGTPCLDKS